MNQYKIGKVDIILFRAPIDTPVRTSFGTMFERTALLIRLEDVSGGHGWGEVWCNFPTCGAEHRANLIETVFAPLLIGAAFTRPEDGQRFLKDKTRILGIQTAEFGPLAQVAAGFDIAFHDLAARRAGLPLHRFLGGQGDGSMPVYASGINPDGAADTVLFSREAGYRAFKLKVGFGMEQDLANLDRIGQGLEPGERLMVDANQAWDLGRARDMSIRLGRYDLDWLEEPIMADRPAEEWAELAAASPFPLAAGENIRGRAEFSQLIGLGSIGVIQPDACKWGGVSACLDVARAALEAGRRYCPHYLGGGIGLIASAHILAAAGGDGLLEVDVNSNPLRENLAQPIPAIKAGQLILSDAPGLGVEPDLAGTSRYIVSRREIR
ncbi:MAG: mandelate racemase/muconate lactonizing enzyme family protein [Deltaproteobacteria bacterium]|nr:mandelate racemase/muconate lactonizing enzyme family protein [Deltaproteobacteria bacterium]